MKHLIAALAIVLMIMGACSPKKQAPKSIHQELNSAYYWKTVFHLDSADLAFIDRHHIRRIYLRMFDVSYEPNLYTLNGKVQPNASVSVKDDDYLLLTRGALNHCEFVPVVYITLDALKAMKGHEGVLAKNMVTRVCNMCSYNAIPNVAELQLDCDWTVGTEPSFFNLCDSVKQTISSLELPWRLSSTIRLHQLARQAPPVDNGVLMVYNTGRFNDPDAANSIIDVKDIAPYLKHLSDYPLPLEVAYPTYSWQLLFRKRQFIGLLYGLNLADTTQFHPKDENVYIAKRDVLFRDRIIRTGDMIREETSSFKDIAAVKNMIEKRLSGRPHSNILYHLDADNLSNYTSDEIDHMLSRAR